MRHWFLALCVLLTLLSSLQLMADEPEHSTAMLEQIRGQIDAYQKQFDDLANPVREKLQAKRKEIGTAKDDVSLDMLRLIDACEARMDFDQYGSHEKSDQLQKLGGGIRGFMNIAHEDLRHIHQVSQDYNQAMDQLKTNLRSYLKQATQECRDAKLPHLAIRLESAGHSICPSLILAALKGSEAPLWGFMQVAATYSSESVVDMHSNCAPAYALSGQRGGNFLFHPEKDARMSPHLTLLYKQAKLILPLYAINCTVKRYGYKALSESATEYLESLAGKSLEPEAMEWTQTLTYTQIQEIDHGNGIRERFETLDLSNLAVDIGINLVANAVKRRMENLQRDLFFKNINHIVRTSRSEAWRILRDLQSSYGVKHPTLDAYDIQITAQPIDRGGNRGTIAFENLSASTIESAVIIVEGMLPPEGEHCIDGYFVPSWKPQGCVTLPRLAFSNWKAGGTKKPSGLRCMIVTMDGVVFDQELSLLPTQRLFPVADKPNDHRLELIAESEGMQLKEASAELLKLVKQHNELVTRAKEESQRYISFAERIAKKNKAEGLAARVQHAKDLLKKGDYPEPFYGTVTNQLKLTRQVLRRRCDELEHVASLREKLAYQSMATKLRKSLDTVAAYDKLEKPPLHTSGDVDASMRLLAEHRDRFFASMEKQLETMEKQALSNVGEARSESDIRTALFAFYDIRMKGIAPPSKTKDDLETLVRDYVELVESKALRGDVAAIAVLKPVLNRYRPWLREEGVNIQRLR